MLVGGRLCIIREGQGEAEAVDNLVVRVAQSLNLVPRVFRSFLPSPRLAITSPATAIRAARVAAQQSPAAALLTADLDDGCPALVAPEFAAAVRNEGFAFPIALVLFHREFETLAVAVAGTLAGQELKSKAGQTILRLSAPRELLDNPERPRDAKGWVQRELMAGVSYKPTVHQLPLTRLLSLEALRASRLSSYVRLENALKHLAAETLAGSADVYPGQV